MIHRPSRAAIAAAMRHYELMRPDGEPPPNKTAGGLGRAVTAVDAAGGNKNNTRRHQNGNQDAVLAAVRAGADTVAAK